MLLKSHPYLDFIKQYFSAKLAARIITLVVFLVCANTVLLAAESEAGASPLMDFIWKVVNVIVLGAIIYKFAKKPVVTALSTSAESAKKLISDAREAEEKLKADLDEMRGKIAGLEKEAEQIVKTARKDAEIEKERIIEEGRQEIERMKRQASFALEQERRKAEADLRHWIAEESVALAEKEMKQEINQNQQNKLVNKYMDELSRTEGAA
ncbi:F0F1 ATP synthase subunit B [Deltaproteobacteria bacterium]|nr:F0F1 ATP synthase subunit B [Deltaproteobacteria bacterium]